MTVENPVAQGSTKATGEDRWVEPELARLARRAAAEGTVLLANDGALPLPDGEPVAVFGRVQLDWFAVGYGSGGDVNAAYEHNLLDCLTERGVAVDAELAAVYREWCTANPPEQGEWGNWPRYYEEMPLDDALVDAAATRARRAVVVIGRAAGEDRENVLEPGSYYLTEAERILLEQVTSRFESVTAVVCSGNVMDLSWAEGTVGALLMAWPGGMEGAPAVADVLTGAVEPGGRLTDTIARRYEDYPSAGHFGGTEFNEYTEDVLVGYRYFETVAKDAVLFPFGHGLGYTTFDLAPGGLVVERAGGPTGGTARVAVTATNTGERPGSTVVQVYAGAPQDPALATPARRLIAYQRTEELAPGASQELVLALPLDRLASFDDSGATGHRNAWVLEAGAHEVLVGSSVCENTSAGSVDVPDAVVLEQLEEALAPDPARPFQRMTLTTGADGCPALAWEDVPTATVDLRERIVSRLPRTIDAAPPADGRILTLQDVAAGLADLDAFIAQLSPAELADLTFGDVIMDSPLGVPGNAGTFGGVTKALRGRGIPAVTTTDGPSGLRLSAYASLLPCGTALASTWDPALLTELARHHGAEMVRKGSDVLLAPGMNIHRDPLCGRNFEYYSEDPLVAGLTAAAVVTGIQANGVSACPKHFAANNQETNRIHNDSRISQRALREIYLRGFRLCVELAAPLNIMTSYNKVNGQWSHYNYDLVTTILRDEWGYRGNVITDWWMRYAPDPIFPALADSATRVRAGVDVLMPGAPTWAGTHAEGHDSSELEALDAEDASGEHLTLGELQRSARNVLRMLLASGKVEGYVPTEPEWRDPVVH